MFGVILLKYWNHDAREKWEYPEIQKMTICGKKWDIREIDCPVEIIHPLDYKNPPFSSETLKFLNLFVQIWTLKKFLKRNVCPHLDPKQIQ